MASPATDDESKQTPSSYPPPPIYFHPNSTHPPPPYQSYPPPYPSTNKTYPFTAPPPAAYYHHQHPPVYHEPIPHLTFARFILITTTLLLISACVLSFLTWLIFGALTPEFFVKSLSVSSFNVSDNSLMASWDINITVKNPNNKIDIFFERLEGLISYKNTILELADVDLFDLSRKGEVVCEMKVATTHRESLAGNYHGLVEDRRRGEVSFALRMIATTTFGSGTLWRRRLSFRVFCEDLDVKFDGPMGPGKLKENGDGMQKGCVLYM